MALKELVDSVQQSLADLDVAVNKQTARNVVDIVLQSIAVEAKEGSIRIPNFGTFKMKTKAARPARMGRNPSTGEALELPATSEKEYLAFKQAA